MASCLLPSSIACRITRRSLGLAVNSSATPSGEQPRISRSCSAESAGPLPSTHPPILSSCSADLDGDCAVGIVDLLERLEAWGTDPGGPPDLDGDVGIVDFLELLAVWGPCA